MGFTQWGPKGTSFTDEQLRVNFTTGWRSGGEVTINSGDNTKYDVAAGTGVVMDYTDEENPIPIFVSFGPFIAVTLPDIADFFTIVFINANGDNVATSGTTETAEDRRKLIVLQGLLHVSGVIIESVTTRTIPATDYAKSIADVVLEMMPANVGNDYSTNGTNLQIQKATGATFTPNINQRTDLFDPSRIADSAAAPAPMIRHFRDGSGGFSFDALFTVVDPNFFDDGSGTLVAMDPNKFQTQLVFWGSEGAVSIVSYGQKVYNSMSEAKEDIPFQVLDIETTLTSDTNLLAILIMRTGTTSLEDISDAELLPNRFNFFQ